MILLRQKSWPSYSAKPYLCISIIIMIATLNALTFQGTEDEAETGAADTDDFEDNA